MRCSQDEDSLVVRIGTSVSSEAIEADALRPPHHIPE